MLYSTFAATCTQNSCDMGNTTNLPIINCNMNHHDAKLECKPSSDAKLECKTSSEAEVPEHAQSIYAAMNFACAK